MNRTIEFRVWHNEYKHFVNLTDGFENWTMNLSDGTVSFFQNCEDGNFGAQDVTLTQFTGLLDKNKNKIFEGDIVKVNPDGVFDRIAQIFYTYNRFEFLHKGQVPAWQFSSIFIEKIEIIGNIFETPELLEK